MTKSANLSSVAAESNRAKLDEEMSKPVSNMFLILRSGRKPRDGAELGSGLQEDENPLTSTPSPSDTTTEDQKLSLDSAEADHLLPGVPKKNLPSVSTKTQTTVEFAVIDLDPTQDSNLHRQEPPTTVSPFLSHSLSHTEFLTVDFFDTRSHGNKFVPPAPTAHELQGREPTAWAMPGNYLTLSPSSEEDTTKPDEYQDGLSSTPPPPPPRTFHPSIPKPFTPARGREPASNHKKVGKSSSAECRLGSVLVNGTCRSQCDTMPNYCLNGGQCFMLEGTGVFCR